MNRAVANLTNYPQTPGNEDALILMIRSYDMLGMPQLRDDAQRVLRQNFPTSQYFTGGDNKPWWKFWQSDEVLQLLQRDTVRKSQENPGPAPPDAATP